MLTKNKKTLSEKKFIAHSTQLGLVLMSLAATVGMLELPDRQASRVVVPNQPIFAFESQNAGNNPIQREREDIAPHYISYSVMQRTPSRHGKR